MRTASITASIAVLCLAADPLLAEAFMPQERTLVAQLCDGGEVTIPIGRNDEGEPHCPNGKACHAANCRKQFDPEQRRPRK